MNHRKFSPFLLLLFLLVGNSPVHRMNVNNVGSSWYPSHLHHQSHSPQPSLVLSLAPLFLPPTLFDWGACHSFSCFANVFALQTIEFCIIWHFLFPPWHHPIHRVTRSSTAINRCAIERTKRGF